MKQEEYIIEAKSRVQDKILKDSLIMFFTRILEDLKKDSNAFLFGRIKDLYYLINPYQNSNKREIYEFFKGEIVCKEGLVLDDEEINFCRILFDDIKEDFSLRHGAVMKGRILGIIKKLILKYFPNSYEVVEPFIFSKILCSVGGIERLVFLPSSTIQLIGAEKALFRHKKNNNLSPKYGLLYLSKRVQESSNKGKESRKLANKIFILIKLDYFRLIAR